MNTAGNNSRAVVCNGETVEIRPMTPDDEPALSRFVRGLPAHDLLFLRRDVSEPRVLAAWIEAIREARVASLVAFRGDALVGCTAIVTEKLTWSSHVGELRILVRPDMRGKGLGRALIQECFSQALDLGLEKLCVQMTIDQRAAIAVFEELGFRAEGVLRDHVRDRAGNSHDLALLGHDVRKFQATLDVYGISDALQPQREAN